MLVLIVTLALVGLYCLMVVAICGIFGLTEDKK